MGNQRELRSVLTGPITGREPSLLDRIPNDNLVGALTSLASEVYILRERMAVMEAELTRRRVFEKNDIENFKPTADEEKAIQKDLDDYVSRFWSELARDDSPVSHIDPGVEKYLGDHKS